MTKPSDIASKISAQLNAPPSMGNALKALEIQRATSLKAFQAPLIGRAFTKALNAIRESSNISRHLNAISSVNHLAISAINSPSKTTGLLAERLSIIAKFALSDSAILNQAKGLDALTQISSFFSDSALMQTAAAFKTPDTLASILKTPTATDRLGVLESILGNSEFRDSIKEAIPEATDTEIEDAIEETKQSISTGDISKIQGSKISERIWTLIMAMILALVSTFTSEIAKVWLNSGVFNNPQKASEIIHEIPVFGEYIFKVRLETEIRSRRRNNAKPLGTLKPDDIVIVTEKFREWVKIECKGIEGYIRVDYLTSFEPAEK